MNIKDKKNETPEQKQARLERHQKYMDYLFMKNFETGFSQIFNAEFIKCKRCERKGEATTITDQKAALEHYFSLHHNDVKAERKERQKARANQVAEQGSKGAKEEGQK